jgi:hypothetical protein
MAQLKGVEKRKYLLLASWVEVSDIVQGKIHALLSSPIVLDRSAADDHMVHSRPPA